MKSSVREHMTAARGGTVKLKPPTQIARGPAPSTTRRAF
jgi:hypothetical protein